MSPGSGRCGLCGASLAHDPRGFQRCPGNNLRVAWRMTGCLDFEPQSGPPTAPRAEVGRALQQLAHGMLNALRKQAGSWVVKALLMLLVASFAIWGIGDVFYGSSQNPAVATVGESEISATELANAFNRSLRNLQERVGGQLSREQAIQLGVMQQALQDLIAQRLLDLRARDMGLAVTDATLRGLVTSDPMFQAAGSFDRARFEQLLMASGLNEDDYLASLRQDVMRSALSNGVAGAAVVPQTLVDAMYRHRNEQRARPLCGGREQLDHGRARADRGGPAGLSRGASGSLHGTAVPGADLHHPRAQGPGRRGRGRARSRSRPSTRRASRATARPSGARSSSCWRATARRSRRRRGGSRKAAASPRWPRR